MNQGNLRQRQFVFPGQKGGYWREEAYWKRRKGSPPPSHHLTLLPSYWWRWNWKAISARFIFSLWGKKKSKVTGAKMKEKMKEEEGGGWVVVDKMMRWGLLDFHFLLQWGKTLNWLFLLELRGWEEEEEERSQEDNAFQYAGSPWKFLKVDSSWLFLTRLTLMRLTGARKTRGGEDARRKWLLFIQSDSYRIVVTYFSFKRKQAIIRHTVLSPLCSSVLPRMEGEREPRSGQKGRFSLPTCSSSPSSAVPLVA